MLLLLQCKGLQLNAILCVVTNTLYISASFAINSTRYSLVVPLIIGRALIFHKYNVKRSGERDFWDVKILSLNIQFLDANILTSYRKMKIFSSRNEILSGN